MLASGQAPVPYVSLIVGWFVRERGLATGIVLAGSGLGIAVMPVVLSTVIGEIGWQSTYVLIGIIVLVVNLTVAIFVLEDPPRPAATDTTEQVGVAARLPGATLDKSVRSLDFWIIMISFGMTAMIAAGGSISLPSIMIERGYSMTFAASLMGAVGIAMIFARIFVGWMLDRFSPILLASVVFLGPAIGYACLAADLGLAGPVVAAVAFGLTLGTEGDALPYLLARRFGPAHFGIIYGFQFCTYAISTGFGLGFLDSIRSALGDDSAYATTIGLAIASALLLATIYQRKLDY